MEIFLFIITLMIVVNWALNNVQKKNDQQKMIDKIKSVYPDADAEMILKKMVKILLHRTF